ncbi:hypothetical protein F0U60_27200 [Archangium minus]|uniref:Bulb-type lectin domain-containing protein n=2 Tax=Archangium minus TaxID=83450 RepID=A0ABY9XB29_9BACT|nr:hypothetical protein F0U60_27200 [Archangium minus]
MRLAIALPTAAPGDISRIAVTVLGDDMAPRSTDLVLTDGIWGGILGDLPAGTRRTFEAQAFTASSTLRYRGRAEDVTITAGATGSMTLTLHDVSGPPPFTNEAPIIDSLVASSAIVAPNGTLTLTASAHDPNVGDTVSYAWTAPRGIFSAPTQTSTTWTASTLRGPVSLSLTLRDSRGAALTVSVTVKVSTGSETEPSWTSTGDMHGARYTHVATLLANGRVLVSGGNIHNTAVSWAEVYDPATGRWNLTASMASARQWHTATLLPTGKVLVAGGSNDSDYVLGAELYDPATGTWSPTGLMSAHRTRHTATLLPSGKVLVTGGASGGVLASAELYDPTTGKWTPTGSMSKPRHSHCATLLANGKVLITGGNEYSYWSTLEAEVYDPATGTWSPTGSMSTSRSAHTATLLPSGKVLVTGGDGGGAGLTAEVYDPATGTWSPTGSMALTRSEHVATLLPSGKVLVTGGSSTTGGAERTEVYDPALGTWRFTLSMTERRYRHSATLLSTGEVLVAGGLGLRDYLATAEVYDPAMGP